MALLFDNETSGLIANHTIKLSEQPEVIEFYGCLADLHDGTIVQELEHLIKPRRALSDKPNPGDKKSIIDITGITNEMLIDKPSFSEVADQICSFIEEAPLVMAHNVAFDMEMLDIEYERLKRAVKWPRAVCTVEATSYLNGARMSLTKLHQYLFGEIFADAHRAKPDTLAQLKCAVELFKRGII
jgi:DNA polymerase III epsilon subunit family exonuclease